MSVWPFSRGPEHCSMCGDEFVEATYVDGFRRDGSPNVKRWPHCPRNGEGRPDPFERRQIGRCHPPHPFICANERRAWAEHRPWWDSCGHHSVNDDGSKCWAKDGSLITGADQPEGSRTSVHDPEPR